MLQNHKSAKTELAAFINLECIFCCVLGHPYMRVLQRMNKATQEYMKRLSSMVTMVIIAIQFIQIAKIHFWNG